MGYKTLDRCSISVHIPVAYAFEISHPWLPPMNVSARAIYLVYYEGMSTSTSWGEGVDEGEASEGKSVGNALDARRVKEGLVYYVRGRRSEITYLHLQGRLSSTHVDTTD